MRTAALILTAAFMLAGAASAQQAPTTQPQAPATPTDFTPPRLVQSPSEETMMALYPPNALNQGVVGRISTICLIGADGTPRDCVAESAEPHGWDFEEAAIRVAGLLRYEPAQRQGRPTPVRIRRGIAFRVPEREHDPRDALTPEMREMIVDWPLPETPAWDDAPTAADVATAFPAAARAAGVTRARALLSCRANADRSLACIQQSETPAGLGFAEAALGLARRFRIAEIDAAFASAHAETPFLLPINFGFAARDEPVSTTYSGARPIHLIAPKAVSDAVYPEAARAGRKSGEAVALCTIVADAAPHCQIENETPPGLGFGAAAMSALSRLPALPSEQMELLPGDQMRITFRFEPEPAP